MAGARPVRFARRRILDTSWTPGAEPEPGVVAGLLDGEGFCLALGVVEEVAEDSVLVLTPWRTRRAVARLQVGGLRAERWEGPAAGPAGPAGAGGEPAVDWLLSEP
jgi:polynucleotide 5'-kinase involved in rRNA processing